MIFIFILVKLKYACRSNFSLLGCLELKLLLLNLFRVKVGWGGVR